MYGILFQFELYRTTYINEHCIGTNCTAGYRSVDWITEWTQNLRPGVQPGYETFLLHIFCILQMYLVDFAESVTCHQSCQKVVTTLLQPCDHLGNG